MSSVTIERDLRKWSTVLPTSDGLLAKIATSVQNANGNAIVLGKDLFDEPYQADIIFSWYPAELFELGSSFVRSNFKPDFPNEWTREKTKYTANTFTAVLQASPIYDQIHTIFVDDLGKYIIKDKADPQNLKTYVMALVPEGKRPEEKSSHEEKSPEEKSLGEEKSLHEEKSPEEKSLGEEKSLHEEKSPEEKSPEEKSPEGKSLRKRSLRKRALRKSSHEEKSPEEKSSHEEKSFEEQSSQKEKSLEEKSSHEEKSPRKRAHTRKRASRERAHTRKRAPRKRAHTRKRAPRKRAPRKRAYTKKRALRKRALRKRSPEVYTINIRPRPYIPGEPEAKSTGVPRFQYWLDNIPGFDREVCLEEWDFRNGPWHLRNESEPRESNLGWSSFGYRANY